MLRKHFPDFPERIDHEIEMRKHYHSGSLKITAAKRANMRTAEPLLTYQEKDAFDYFSGRGFYEPHQNPKTSPNRFDSRRSFLLKMEDDQMRNEFLNSYNKKAISKY